MKSNIENVPLRQEEREVPTSRLGEILDDASGLSVSSTQHGRRERNRALQILFGERPIRHVGGASYLVPSESSSEAYAVNLARAYCECPQYRKTRRPCKHVYAARMFVAKVDRGEFRLLPQSNPYKNPVGYDAVKAREELSVREMLRCLGLLVPYDRLPGKGRPPVRLGDILVCHGLATYANRSTRRAIPDPAFLFSQRLTAGQPPCAATLRHYMASPAFNGAVKSALATTGACVRELERYFAIDSVFVKTPNCEIVVQQRSGKAMIVQRAATAKISYAVGCKTLVAVAATVTNDNVSDQTQFLPLLEQFAPRFLVDAVLADAGYKKAEHYEAVRAFGARAYIDFDKNVKPQAGFPHYNEMLELHRQHFDVWNEVYKYRKLIETSNSVFKRTIKRILRARKELSRENEALTLLLVHNLARLHMARHEYGIEIPFADDRAMAVLDGVAPPAVA